MKMENYPFDTASPDKSISTPARQLPFEPDLSITRLVVGLVLKGMDNFFDRLKTWEVMRLRSSGVDLPAEGEKTGVVENSEQPIVPLLKYNYSQEFLDSRDAVVGMIFLTRRNLIKGYRVIDHIQQNVARKAAVVTRPIRSNRIVQPIQDRFDQLVARGEQEVSAIIQLGRRESDISRKLADTAVDNTVNDYIEYLAENPEVKELVQTQSTGLADEVVEEFRERSVSADTFVEGMARYLLGKTPRRELPTPPPEVRARAERLHPERSKE